MSVFRRKRVRNGKRTLSKSYYCRIGGKVVNLGVSDKQTAEIKRIEWIRRMEREAVGLERGQAEQEALERLTLDYLADYLEELETLGRDDEHVGHVKGRISSLVRNCGWHRLGDLSASSFEAWRRKQNLSPKTLNEYLSAANAFCKWLTKRRHLSGNPLEAVERVEQRGRQGVRRALSPDEMTRLLAHAGPNRPIYLLAAHSGLRRGEIESLRWGDVDLTSAPPCIRARASTTKNKRDAVIPMHEELRAALADLRPANASDADLVFVGSVPAMKHMRKDFDAAGIPAYDSQGRKADFHSLRKTFNVLLQNHGASFATAMNLMRHSDPRLTAKTYMDAALLPQAEVIANIPYLGVGGRKKGTQKGTGNTVGKGFHVSATVQKDEASPETQALAIKDYSSEEYPSVRNCPKLEMVEAGGIEPPSECA